MLFLNKVGYKTIGNFITLLAVVFGTLFFTQTAFAQDSEVISSRCFCYASASSYNDVCTFGETIDYYDFVIEQFFPFHNFRHILQAAVSENSCTSEVANDIIEQFHDKYDVAGGPEEIRLDRESCDAMRDYTGVVSRPDTVVQWNYYCRLREETKTYDSPCDVRRFEQSCREETGATTGSIYNECLKNREKDCRIARGELCVDGTQPSETGGCTALEESIKTLNQLNLGGGSVTQKVRNLIGRLIRYLLGFTGSIALAMFVAGGFIWMTARGNSERTSKALKMMTWASLGVVVILSSYVILNFIFDLFT